MTLPEVTIPDIHSFESIVASAEQACRTCKPRVAIFGFNDPTARDLAAHLIKRNAAYVTMLCTPRECDNPTLADTGLFTLQECDNVSSAMDFVAKSLAEDSLDLVVSGQLSARKCAQGLVGDRFSYARKMGQISQITLLQPSRYPKLLMLTDTGLHPKPDLTTKISLVQNLAWFSAKIGIPKPRLAIVGAVEVIYPQMQATVDGAVLSKMAERRQLGDISVDGPLSFDVAVDMFAAHSKGVTNSEVAGQADAILTSRLEVAAGIYHAMSLFGDCPTGSVMVGGKVPIAVNLPTDDLDAYRRSFALAVNCSRRCNG